MARKPRTRTLTFTDAQVARIMPQWRRVEQAEAALEHEKQHLAETFTNLLVGGRVDLTRYVAALEADETGRPIAVLTTREAT